MAPCYRRSHPRGQLWLQRAVVGKRAFPANGRSGVPASRVLAVGRPSHSLRAPEQPLPRRSVLRAGRFTMDIGSRRLISRNRFRNTSGGFTEVEWRWTGPNNARTRASSTLPVERRVSGNILDNGPRLDKEWTNVRLWGVHFSRPDLPPGPPGPAGRTACGPRIGGRQNPGRRYSFPARRIRARVQMT